MSDSLLTVAALRTTVEAELIRGKLEAAGITAVLFAPEKEAEGAPPARVQVQVNPPDFERAMQLLFPIPKRATMPKASPPPVQPSWKCPKCGEPVMGQFPTCWKCGTARDGNPAASVAPPVTFAAGHVPALTLPSLPTPAPPMPSAPIPMPPQAIAGFPAPPQEAPPRISIPPNTPLPRLEIPPISPAAAAEASKPATNGESTIRSAPVQGGRVARTAEDEGLKIVVPAWDAATGKGKSDRASAKKLPTDADDRAARRAWWTAVIGIIFPPLLIYSIIVVLVLGLTNRPLSARGSRFFYGALGINAAIIAAAFVWLGMHR
jgi:hypothetical protein